jgi:hypothetical protein
MDNHAIRRGGRKISSDRRKFFFSAGIKKIYWPTNLVLLNLAKRVALISNDEETATD